MFCNLKPSIPTPIQKFADKQICCALPNNNKSNLKLTRVYLNYFSTLTFQKKPMLMFIFKGGNDICVYLSSASDIKRTSFLLILIVGNLSRLSEYQFLITLIRSRSHCCGRFQRYLNFKFFPNWKAFRSCG